MQSYKIVKYDIQTEETSTETHYYYYTNAFREASNPGPMLSTPPYIPSDEAVTAGSWVDPEQPMHVSVRVDETMDFPYRYIGQYITSWDSDGDGLSDAYQYCSGFMEGPDVLVTAGHCVFDSSKGGFATSLVYFPARNGWVYNYPAVSATSMIVSQFFYLNETAEEDWAIVRLDIPIGVETGWLGKAWTPDSLNGMEVVLSGYPIDESFGEMWSSKGVITRTLTTRLKYSMDTYAGESGSPIYDTDGLVWAIHTRGTEYIEGDSSGTKITEMLYNCLHETYLYSLMGM